MYFECSNNINNRKKIFKIENNKSNNSTFIILIFEISKFRNIGRSTFGRSKFWPPPNFFFYMYENKNEIFISGRKFIRDHTWNKKDGVPICDFLSLSKIQIFFSDTIDDEWDKFFVIEILFRALRIHPKILGKKQNRLPVASGGQNLERPNVDRCMTDISEFQNCEY